MLLRRCTCMLHTHYTYIHIQTLKTFPVCQVCCYFLWYFCLPLVPINLPLKLGQMSLAHACPHVDRSWFKCYETIEVYASSVKTIVFLKKNKKNNPCTMQCWNYLFGCENSLYNVIPTFVHIWQWILQNFLVVYLEFWSKYISKVPRWVSDKFSFFLSVTAEKWVPIIEVPVDSVKVFLEKKKREGFSILGLEQTANSIPLDQYTYPRKTVSSAHKFDLLFSLNI